MFWTCSHVIKEHFSNPCLTFFIPYSTVVSCHFVHSSILCYFLSFIYFLTFSYSISIHFKSQAWVLKVSRYQRWPGLGREIYKPFLSWHYTFIVKRIRVDHYCTLKKKCLIKEEMCLQEKAPKFHRMKQWCPCPYAFNGNSFT